MSCLDAVQQRFLDQVRMAMESYFASDTRRIAHAHEVAGHVVELLKEIEADASVAICAGYLHDIGIPEAERKFGSCNGKLQEQEGPPVARKILAELEAEVELINQVCELVSLHHTPEGVDAPEFRILWDADALVNLGEVVSQKNPEELEQLLSKALVTEPGLRLARGKYL